MQLKSVHFEIGRNKVRFLSFTPGQSKLQYQDNLVISDLSTFFGLRRQKHAGRTMCTGPRAATSRLN